jgi:hypothetical protein
MEYTNYLRDWRDDHAATFHAPWILLAGLHRALLRLSPSCFIDPVVVAGHCCADGQGHFMEGVVCRLRAVIVSVSERVTHNGSHFVMLFGKGSD